MTKDAGAFSEAALLEAIRARTAGLRSPGLLVGPGDDCAVVEVGGARLLLTVDQVVMGRHVTAGTPMDLVARKAIARSVSDIAAMAGVAKWTLVSGLLPKEMTGEEADALCAALHAWGLKLSAPVIGGDIARGGDALSLSVTVVGEMPEGEPAVLRSGAVVGDGVYVTGCVGGSMGADGMGKHLTFEPRVKEACALRSVLGARLHAMMDVSDGVGRDAGRMAVASGVGIEIEAARLPLTAGCAGWKNGMGDGEDYELLFAAAGDVPAMVEGTAVTRIGRVIDGTGCWCVTPEGGREEVSGVGWEHVGGGGA